METNYRDVFLSHAGLDKEEYILPLVKLLEQREISYWLDEAELSWGKSLLELISEGIEKSKYVIAFISETFLDRPWPEAELRAALSKEISTGDLKVLPIFLTDEEKILNKHPFLRDKMWLKWEDGIDKIVENIELVTGRTFKSKWEFIHPARFRGNVWIKIYPRIENIDKEHSYTLDWGRWQRKDKLNFRTGDGIILDFKKISEKDTWPIHFEITPPAFVTAGRGKLVEDINRGWNLQSKKGYYPDLVSRIVQSFLPEND